jgi:hypothetical protein
MLHPADPEGRRDDGAVFRFVFGTGHKKYGFGRFQEAEGFDS